MSGTPVKSCNTMRATTNGTSVFAGDFAFHFASASTSLRRTFFPSQLRSTDSSTIRMLIGNREILPIPSSSRCGNEKKRPSRPLPASNVFSVLNSSFILSSVIRAKRSAFEQSHGSTAGLTSGSLKASPHASAFRCSDFARHDGIHFSSSSLVLIFSKFGNFPGSSLLSAYWIRPFLSTTNAERFGTPPMPKSICGRKESYITS